MIKRIIYGALGFSASALIIANLLTSMPDTYIASSQQNVSKQETQRDDMKGGMEDGGEVGSEAELDSNLTGGGNYKITDLFHTYHITQENLSRLEDAGVVKYGRVNPMLFWEKPDETNGADEGDVLGFDASEDAASKSEQIVSVPASDMETTFAQYGTLPVKEEYYGVSSSYGPRVDPFDGEPEIFHGGLDIASATISGKEVYSVLPGTVSSVGNNPDGYGNFIIINHGEFTTLYAHLEAMPTHKEGDIVQAGDKIGLIGSTGRSTGPHLHLEIDVDGVKIDPEPFMAVVGKEGSRNEPKQRVSEPALQ